MIQGGVPSVKVCVWGEVGRGTKDKIWKGTEEMCKYYLKKRGML